LSDPTEILRKMGRARYINTFDAKSGYHQTIVNPLHRWLTAFVCDEGLFEWVCTPFGLKGAGNTFVHMLQGVLQPVRQFTATFVDDTCVYSDSWRQHLMHLDQYLSTIRDAGLTLNLTRSSLAQGEVRFLGHIVGSGQRRVDPQKVSTVHNLKVPATKRQVRLIIGVFSFFRDYIPNFAKYAKPLTDLTAKRLPNVNQWLPIHEAAFQTLEDLLRQATEQPCTLLIGTNLSIFLWMRVIMQSPEFLHNSTTMVKNRPIAFASSKLNRTPQNWGTIQREAYAAIWSLQRFKQWIFGSKVTLFSNRNPLTFLADCALKSSKLMRWSLAMQEFDIVFKYKPGRENLPADCLSRIGAEDLGEVYPSVAE
jgi:RNase H-like domain found in reverse transcriptase/Reverse transcriptase (RNA-dependent DNA polymerase)